MSVVAHLTTEQRAQEEHADGKAEADRRTNRVDNFNQSHFLAFSFISVWSQQHRPCDNASSFHLAYAAIRRDRA